MEKQKLLLIVPPSTVKHYSKTKMKVAVAEVPLLSLATLAAYVREKGHVVKILDLSMSENPKLSLINTIKNFSPDYVGLTFTTPLFKEAVVTADLVKEINPDIKIVAGGTHITALPEETLLNSKIDIGVIGEGELTLGEILDGKPLNKIKGISFKKNNKIYKTQQRELIEDLDSLPLPAWDLYDIKKYKAPRLISRKNPIGAIETTRGCIFNCTYCNKSIFGKKVRKKSAERVIEEIKHSLDSGFKEIQIWDDNFAIDLKRAKKICDEIIRNKLKFPWNLFVGVRVNCVDQEFFDKIYKAGCYQVGFGIESGNQHLLNNIQKGITLEQARNAARMVKKTKLESVGYFMFGLPGETEKTMKKTIEFAKELDLDYAKVTITLPFPSTPLFNEMEKKGLIKSKDWSKYNFHSTCGVYDHENLSWDILLKYYNKFYNSYYLRPIYILKRIRRNMFSKRILYDVYYSIKTWGVK